MGERQAGCVRYLPIGRELVTDCLQRHPGPLSWNSVLTQVLGSGGRETSKLGRQAGRVEEEEVRAGSWAAEREREKE